MRRTIGDAKAAGRAGDQAPAGRGRDGSRPGGDGAGRALGAASRPPAPGRAAGGRAVRQS